MKYDSVQFICVYNSCLYMYGWMSGYVIVMIIIIVFMSFSVEVYAEFNVIEHYGLLIFAGVLVFVIWDIL